MRAFIVTVVGIVLCGSVMAAQSASDLAKGDAAKGKIAYTDHKCAMCHKTDKDDAKGGKMATVLADTVGKLSNADLKTWLTDADKMEAKLPKKPTVLMSGFLKGQKLTEADVANLVVYLRSLAPAK